MKVLQITEYYPPADIGGAEIHVSHLVEGLRARGSEVSVASFSDVPGVIPFRSREREFRESYWNSIGRPEYMTSFRALGPVRSRSGVADVITRESPDVVHIHNLHDYSSARDAIRYARKAGSRIVWTVHDHWFVCPYSTLLTPGGVRCGERRCPGSCFDDRPLRHRLLARYITGLARRLGGADAVISPSEATAGILRGAGLRPIVVPYGHPAAPFDSIPPVESDRMNNILYAGALEPHKGIRDLLRAVKGMKNTRLRVVGSGTLGSRMRGRSGVELVSRVEYGEMVEHFRWAGIVAVPSIWPDNLPLTVMEAMLSARVVAASAVGGIPEMVAHNSTGMLFNPGDPGSMRMALEDIIKRKDAPAMGLRARERALRKYDMKTYLDRILEIYRGAGE